MTTRHGFAERNRDSQDQTERHIYAITEYVKGAGRYMRMKGTGSEDDEVPVMSPWGLGGAYPKDTNAEVYAFAWGADTNAKGVLADMPADKQRNWKEGTNGIQSWQDKDHAVIFGRDAISVVGKRLSLLGGLIEIDAAAGKVYLRGEVHIGKLRATGAGAPVIPAYDASNDQEA